MCLLFKAVSYTALLILSISLTSAIKMSDWWENAIIYEIYPRSFLDSNGDGIGDLKGIISKLSYLADLGVTAILLAPIFQSPMMHLGYDISNLTAIDPIYGSMAEFEKLVKESKHIKILLDFVPHHTSDKSEWFEKSVNRVKGYGDFYISADSKRSSSAYRHSPNHWEPKLNLYNSRVKKEIDNVLLFWLARGVCGFHVDVSNHPFEPPNFLNEPVIGDPEVYDLLRHWRELLANFTKKEGGPTRILTTEVYATIKLQMDHYQYKDGTDTAHFPYNYLLITDIDKEQDARDFVYTIQKWITYMPHGHVPNWVTGKYDHQRVATRFCREFVDAMNMLVMTLPGVTITYYGEEIGMEDHPGISYRGTNDPLGVNTGRKKYKSFTRDLMQTPFQWDAGKNAGFTKAKKSWLPVHPNYLNVNLKKQKEAARSHYKVYKKLAVLKQHPALRNGSFDIAVINRDVFAFKREVPSANHPMLITVINVSNKTQTVDLTPLGKLPPVFTILVAASTSTHRDGHTVNTSNLMLQSYECLLLQGNVTISAERRAIIRTLIKSANIILVGLLMYKLWHNKWTKLNFNKEALF